MLRSLLIPAALAAAASATPARADPCDTVISSAQSALANPQVTVPEKLFLEELLKAATAAKKAGDLAACQNALQSPRPAGEGGRKCHQTPDTV